MKHSRRRRRSAKRTLAGKFRDVSGNFHRGTNRSPRRSPLHALGERAGVSRTKEEAKAEITRCARRAELDQRRRLTRQDKEMVQSLSLCGLLS